MHTKSQRIAAIIGIVFLLILYLVNFLIGLFCDANSFSLFLASLLATFFIPVIIFCYTSIMKHMHKDNNEEDNNISSN